MRRGGGHPCRCRGNIFHPASHWSHQGSSLPVQGQPFAFRRRVPRHGFIPAGAGATSVVCDGVESNRVHPCRCRGNSNTAARGNRPYGSSLPVQGQRRARHRADHRQGFIPAGAGATCESGWSPQCPWVHPCRCRGNIPAQPWDASYWGSSLPVQGQLTGLNGVQRARGFIPAGAGATPAIAAWRNCPWVHPCRCRGNIG